MIIAYFKKFVLFVLTSDHIENVSFCFFMCGHGKLDLNPPMAKGDECHPPTGFSNFSREWEELSWKLNFSCSLVLGTSVHEKIFQIGPTVLALKLDKGRVLGWWQLPPMDFFTYFSNHEDQIQS